MITLDTATQALDRGMNVPVMTDPQTSMWTQRVKSVPTAGNYSTFFALLGPSGYAGPFIWLGLNDSGGMTPILEVFDGVTDLQVSPGTTFSLNEPFICGYKRDPATNRHTVYLKGFEAFVTLDMSAFSPTQIFLGGDGSATDIPDMDLAWYKEWLAVLSAAQIEAQGFAMYPLITANLVADTWLSSDAVDSSGNGNDWTVNNGPGFTFSPNITAATALAAGAFPFTVTSIPTYLEIDLWYSVTAPLDQVVSMLATSGLSVRSYVRVYEDPVAVPPPATPTYLNADSINEGRVQIPMASGQTLLVRIGSDEIVLADTLDFKGQAFAPLATIPVGSIIVNSDEPGYPAAVIDQATGHILGYRLDVVAGETADTLHTVGRSLLADTVTNEFALYDQDMNLLTTVPGYVGSVGSGNQVDKFLIRTVEETSPGVFAYFLRTVTITGTVSSTAWGPLPDGPGSPQTVLQLVAVSRDETVAYLMYSLTQGGSGANDVIKRWDMVNNVALSDFATPPAGFRYSQNGVSPGILLVLGDESVVIAYWRNNLSDSFLQRYDRNGTLLWTMPWDTVTGNTSSTIDRGMHDPTNDTDYFWVWDKIFGLGRFNKMNASDGTRVSYVPTDMGSVPIVTSPSGPGSPEVRDGGTFLLRNDQTFNPDLSLDVPFAHPFSCPSVITGLTGGPVCPGDLGPPREDGLLYSPPFIAPCEGTGTKGNPRTGA